MALVILKLTNSVALAAAGAILGVLSGSLVASLYMGVLHRKEYAAMEPSEEVLTGSGRSSGTCWPSPCPLPSALRASRPCICWRPISTWGQLLTYSTQAQADTMKGV